MRVSAGECARPQVPINEDVRSRCDGERRCARHRLVGEEGADRGGDVEERMLRDQNRAYAATTRATLIPREMSCQHGNGKWQPDSPLYNLSFRSASAISSFASPSPFRSASRTQELRAARKNQDPGRTRALRCQDGSQARPLIPATGSSQALSHFEPVVFSLIGCKARYGEGPRLAPSSIDRLGDDEQRMMATRDREADACVAGFELASESPPSCSARMR